MPQTLRAGGSPAEINEFLRVPRSTPCQISKGVRQQEGGDDPQDKNISPLAIKNINRDLGGQEHQQLIQEADSGRLME